MDKSVMISGNLGCVAYYLTKYLQVRGIDATLYLWNWEMEKDPRNPLKADLELEELPDWIKFFPDGKRASLEYRKASKNHDIIHAFNTDPMYAQLTGKPFISHPVGSDARLFAFEKGVQPMMLRRAFKKNDAFFLSQCDYYRTVLPKLKIRNVVNVPLIHNFTPDIDTAIVPEREEADMIFFHPTSIIWDIKGNQMLIEAYSKFVKEHNPSSRLILIEWGADLEKTKALIGNLGITEHVVFKKWLDKKSYFQYMKYSDVIFDQFLIPSGCTIQREANALGKLLVKHSDEHWFKMYDEKPFVSAGTVEEIYNVLVDYHENPDAFKKLAESGKAFIQKYNHWKSVTDKVIAEYEKILGG